MNNSKQSLSPEYGSWRSGLKQQIAAARQKAGLSLNEAIIKLYWQIGMK